MSRSIRASKQGTEKVNKAFNLSGKTKEYITGASGCSRPTFDKFLGGKNIDKQKFIAICEALKPRFRTSKCSIKKYIVLKSPKIIPGQEYFSFH